MASKKTTAPAVEDDMVETDADGATSEDAPQASDGDVTLDALADALSAEAEDDLIPTEMSPQEAELIALRAEHEELKDKLLRSLADGENARRRADRDRKDAERYGGAKLARDLLAVLDNLDRAMEAATDEFRAQAPDFIEGVELTRRELLSAFSKHQIEKVAPELGERFDPNRHQAMFEAPVPGAQPGTIIQVMQPGFVIHDRLLRAAMVGVAKADPNAKPAPKAEAPEDAEDSAPAEAPEEDKPQT